MIVVPSQLVNEHRRFTPEMWNEVLDKLGESPPSRTRDEHDLFVLAQLSLDPSRFFIRQIGQVDGALPDYRWPRCAEGLGHSDRGARRDRDGAGYSPRAPNMRHRACQPRLKRNRSGAVMVLAFDDAAPGARCTTCKALLSEVVSHARMVRARGLKRGRGRR